MPVLLQEVLANLVQSSQGTYVDATFGRGGHSRALLEQLSQTASVVGLDRDLEAVEHGLHLAAADHRFSVHHAEFSRLQEVLQAQDKYPVDGVLMDLGVSSPQLDTAHRGFSFRLHGPLDMRMNSQSGLSAAEWINSAAEQEIANVIFQYGEERASRRIARKIVAERPLYTTTELANVVESAIPNRGRPKSAGGRAPKHPATKTFQGIRIFINQEDEQLKAGIEAAFAALKVAGRLAIISFHSLEDRVVKQAFRALCTPPTLPRRIPVPTKDIPVKARAVVGPLRPSVSETQNNIRARSATLRVIEKLEEQAA